jgi:hypothetical protein
MVKTQNIDTATAAIAISFNISTIPPPCLHASSGLKPGRNTVYPVMAEKKSAGHTFFISIPNIMVYYLTNS